MVEEVVIKITKDTKGVEDTVKLLEKIGEVDKKNSEQFKKSNDEYIEAAKKRERIIAEEEANIKSLEKAKKKAFSPEDIKLYDDAIKQSKENIRLLKGESEKLEKSNDMLAKGFKRLGAVIIAAFSIHAIKEFAKNAIESSQVTNDKWKAAMGGMQEATEYFFRAVAEGDFSNLISGLEEAYEAGKKYAEALDLLADTQRAVLIQTSEIDLKLSKQKLIARSKEYSAEERKAAVDEYKKLQKKKLKLAQTQAREELIAISDLSSSRSRLSAIALEEIIKSVDWQKKIVEGTKLQTQLENEATKTFSTKAGIIVKQNKDMYNAAYERLTSEEKLIVSAANAYNNLDDQIRESLKEKLIQKNIVEKQYQDGLQEISRIENGLNAEMEAERNKRTEKRTKKEKEAERLRIEAMQDGAVKEQALEELRYDNYVEQYGESEDALKIHLRNMEAIKKKYFDNQEKLNLEQQNRDQQAREDYNKMIQDAIEAEDKELEKREKERDKQLIEEKKLREEQIQSYFDFLNNLANYTFDTMSDRHDLIMKMLNEEINKQETNIETQQRLAERGLSNTLSFEQTKLNELEKQRLEAEKKEERRQKAAIAAKLALSFFEAYSKNLETMQPTPALTKAFKDTMMAKILGTAIGNMYEDGGIVGMDGKPLKSGILQGARHSQGGIPIIAEGGEGILSRKEIANMGIANFYNLKAMLSKPLVSGVGSGNGEVLAGINELNKTLKGIPSIHYGIDNLGQIVKTEVRAGLKNVTTYKRGIN